MENNWRNKTIEALEKRDFGNPAEAPTPLTKRCLELSKKPLGEFSAEDLRLMIGQRFSLNFGKAVIYGNFIQRLGFSSGGFPQDIRLLNLKTNEIVAFRVKPTFKSAKENPFCYRIDPGEYAIDSYYWTQSKWYGGTMNTEPIFKNKDASGNERFILRLYADTVYYTGTWHFDKEQVSFSDEKRSLDSALAKKYKKLILEKATSRLPN